MQKHLAAALAALTLLPAAAFADGAAVSGTVKFAGGKHAPGTLAVTRDNAICGASKADEALLVDATGGVKNAVVSIEGVANPPAPAAGTATVDQKQCQFVPRIQAVSTGSQLVVSNSDGVLHNVHAFLDGSTLFNLAMPQPKMQVKRKLAKPGLVTFRCDAGHTWMSAAIWTFPHPYFAVTDAAGKFSIKDVPPGSYKVHVWHEGWQRKDGTSIATNPVVVDQPLTVEAGKGADVTVELK